MDTLSIFVNDISSFNITIPLWLKIGLIFVLIISLVVGGYFIKDTFDILYLKGGFSWFIFVAVMNLTTILIVFYYYDSKTGSYKGPPGKIGKKGKRGKVGSSTTCTYQCKKNIYIETVRKTDKICTLNTYFAVFKTINNNYQYFANLIEKGNNIDYTSFLNNLIMESEQSTMSQDVVNKFSLLCKPVPIAILLLKSINEAITTASEYTYGTFRSPVPKVGYIPLGDCVYGGIETFDLNSFVVQGNIMYPSGYNKLVSFTSYNEITGENDKYTIWSQISQTINEPKTPLDLNKLSNNINNKISNQETEQHSFLPLGDVCSVGDIHPKLSDYAMIKDDCLEPVSSKELKLVFIYAGNIEFNDTNNKLDYTQTDSYLIENKVANNIEIFSVWRTPMNTFITNCNSQNILVNNTLIFNILNNLDDALNEYGNISNEYKKWVQDKLQSIQVPQFIIAMIYTRHFEIESIKELIYYINKYKSQVPEFQGNSIKNNSLGELLNLINNIQKSYNNFNEQLIKNASISLRGTKPIIYNEKTEKKLPLIITEIYTNITNTLNTLPIQIENSSSLLDIVNTIIPNGLQGRIAIDSDGIAEGGILMNEIQEVIVRLCKIIFPPNRKTYTIKDECLGTFGLDRERENKIKELTDEKDKYNKYIDNISKDYDKYQSQLSIIRNYEDLAMNKMGMLCGYIPDYMNKIHDMDMEEFTTNRIKGLISIYKEVNGYLNNIITNTS